MLQYDGNSLSRDQVIVLLTKHEQLENSNYLIWAAIQRLIWQQKRKLPLILFEEVSTAEDGIETCWLICLKVVLLFQTKNCIDVFYVTKILIWRGGFLYVWIFIFVLNSKVFRHQTTSQVPNSRFFINSVFVSWNMLQTKQQTTKTISLAWSVWHLQIRISILEV